ncbi:MAG TPA: tetratricopeptide repeat protein [Pyrinomonadaceae bacterium]|nr:tetratricopeptide repeat protein [Pyrinomonadaceae bacterium]
MSSLVAKSVKKVASRSGSRHSSATSSTRKRVIAGKSTRLKPATKRSPAGKARARKATKVRSPKQRTKASISLAKRRGARTPSKAKKPTKVSRRVSAAQPKKVAVRNALRAIKKSVALPPRKQVPPPQPTRDEAAALSAFEAAHKDFTRGRFAEARHQFRALVEKYPTVSEVTARARTYLAVAEARLRTELALPRDADSLYDRGVIELNRGEYVAAQELFERALRREPEAAHIHYGLAATRARLGAIDTALKSLKRALDLQPNLRIRAQRDHDLNPLRSDPEFEQLVFAARG